MLTQSKLFRHAGLFRHPGKNYTSLIPATSMKKGFLSARVSPGE
jgi:hypothetical protein